MFGVSVERGVTLACGKSGRCGGEGGFARGGVYCLGKCKEKKVARVGGTAARRLDRSAGPSVVQGRMRCAVVGVRARGRFAAVRVRCCAAIAGRGRGMRREVNAEGVNGRCEYVLGRSEDGEGGRSPSRAGAWLLRRV